MNPAVGFIVILTVKIVLITGTGAILFISLVLLLAPDVYLRLDDIFSFKLMPKSEFVSNLEGQISYINEWILNNRMIFGSIFTFLSLYNIHNLYSL